jgi:hypothetical protein
VRFEFLPTVSQKLLANPLASANRLKLTQLISAEKNQKDSFHDRFFRGENRQGRDASPSIDQYEKE